MNKFFAKKIVNDEISFLDEDIKHIVKVLRLQINEQIVINYENKQFIATISSIEPLRAKIIKPIEIKQNEYELNVFFSSIKQNHLEIAIQKAVELGCNNFYIFNSYYSQRNIKHNLKRYETIIMNAAKQSNRNDLMHIKMIEDDKRLLALINEQQTLLIADFNINAKPIGEIIKPNLKKIGIVIGPEGGFHNHDLTLLNVNNAYIINLTNTILRSETAMIYMISVIDFLMKGNV